MQEMFSVCVCWYVRGLSETLLPWHALSTREHWQVVVGTVPSNDGCKILYKTSMNDMTEAVVSVLHSGLTRCYRGAGRGSWWLSIRLTWSIIRLTSLLAHSPPEYKWGDIYLHVSLKHQRGVFFPCYPALIINWQANFSDDDEPEQSQIFTSHLMVDFVTKWLYVAFVVWTSVTAAYTTQKVKCQFFKSQ